MYTDKVPLKILTILTFFLLLYACAPKKAIQPERPLPIPEKITPEVLIERVDFSYIKTLRAALRVKIQQGGKAKGTFSGVLFYSHPDRLDARFFGPLRLTIMEILFNRGLLQVFIPSRDLLYSGTIALNRLLPDHDTLEKSVKVMKESDNAWLLYILEQNGTERRVQAVYRFNKTDLSWNGLELYADGKRQVRMEIFKTEDRLPAEMDIYINNTSFHLQLKDITLNRDLGDDYFLPLDASERYPLSLFLRNLELD
ncbi:MAG: hypothetical protein IEMM0007_1746 [bacterium]|nr:MAG: hypothetical protein IEMM0007_1746 [bacterium]